MADAERKDDGRLRAFRGNSFEDYYTHDMRDYPRPAKLFFGVVVAACALWTKLFWHWEVEDAHKLTDGAGERGRMVVGNHVSMLEPVATIVWFYAHGRRIRPVFKSEFDANPFLTWFFSRVGGIPVERGTADMRAVRCARAALQRGEDVLVYPEGTRVRTDERAPLHAGFALMAQLADAEVVPLAVVGARQITPEGTHRKRLFWRVFLKAGDPISFDELPAGRRKQRAEAMERVAMERVFALRDELRREHPGKE